MQYKCEVCHDSGSKNRTGEYLDCPACDMPMIRKALNDFVKSLGPTHPEDVALAIHQRALAMAPKQEALQVIDELSAFEDWAKDHLGQGYSLEIEEHTYANPVTRWAFVAFKAGRAILAAAGPDAAPNVEALRDILLGVIPAKMSEKHGRDFFQGEGQDEHRAEVKGFNACRDEVYDKANKAFQAALSGAKGN